MEAYDQYLYTPQLPGTTGGLNTVSEPPCDTLPLLTVCFLKELILRLHSLFNSESSAAVVTDVFTETVLSEEKAENEQLHPGVDFTSLLCVDADCTFYIADKSLTFRGFIVIWFPVSITYKVANWLNSQHKWYSVYILSQCSKWALNLIPPTSLMGSRGSAAAVSHADGSYCLFTQVIPGE